MTTDMTTYQPLTQIRAKRSFRLGVTSYVYPADILTNVKALAPVADDIELVFFESREFGNFPTPAAVEEWRTIADAHGISFTIHFPIDKAMGSTDPGERSAFLAVAERLITLCRPLNVHGWILHLEGIGADAPPERVSSWQQDLRPLLRRFAALVDDPRRVCVENLGYPFSWCEPLLDELPFSVCLDFGHLWQMQYDWKAHVLKWLPRTRIIHLYGTDLTSRHFALDKSPAPLVREALASIGDYDGVLTLETFGFEDTDTSLRRLEACLTR